jgi:hypothetical protein
LYERLKKFDSGKIKQEDHYNITLNAITHRHITLKDFLKLPESDNDFFRFCFVKNIYDRIYSGYVQRHYRLTVDEPYRKSSEEYIKELEAINEGFEFFVEYIYELYKKSGSIRGDFLHEYAYHNGRNMLDFTGYVERFETDFNKACNILNLNEIESVNANVRSEPLAECDPKNMRITDYKYIKKYTKKSIEIVNTCYARDFELFGYQKLDQNIFPQTLPDETPLTLKI